MRSLVVCLGLGAAFAGADVGRPNVLLILADDMGYGDLGCFGSTQVRTPRLDRLAAGGVRFTDAYVTASVCAPSRAGLLTGRYPQRFGFEHNTGSPAHVKEGTVGIPPDETLLSDRLKALGYRTGIVGKWHVGQSLPGHHPNARGFDFFMGMLGGSHPYWSTPEKNRLSRGRGPVGEIREPYLTDWFTAEAVDFIRGREDNGDGPREAGSGPKPWFLYLSFNSPHTPMQAKDEDLADFAPISPKRRRTYCAMQQCMDRGVGRIVDVLRETGQLESTLIVFLSDNGGSVTASSAINAPLNGMKGMMLEGGNRVPMIWHWPGGLAGGRVYRQPVITLDLTPTFVTLAGGSVPEAETDGVDLMPHLRGEKSGRPHERLFWRMTLRGSAVRSGDWKLVRTPHHPTMLFDLSQDVSEQHNLAAERPDVVARLVGEYADWDQTLDNPRWISGPRWAKYNRKLYDQPYETEQPAGDTTRY